MNTLPLRDKVRFWLVELSIDSGLSQAHIADLIGISYKHLNLIWHGKAGMSWEMADRWAEALNVRIDVNAVVMESTIDSWMEKVSKRV